MSPEYLLEGKIVDIVNNQIFEGKVVVADGRIKSIEKHPNNKEQYILPGLIDAHIHIESSMLIPSEFGRVASVHGTVASVSDPHEIANVLGMDGIDFMIENGKQIPFKFYFGAPPCVPATTFESSGAMLGVEEMNHLLSKKEIKYMGEMMNFPGVINHDPEVMAKIQVAKKHHKPIDGHAPGLEGEDVRKYIEAGISTDHECSSMEEALGKINLGMKVQIREGSAARNFDTLIGLLHDHADQVLFCSDDKHPDELTEGHINLMVRKAIALGYDPIKVLRVATLNAVRHYQLEVGLLQEGDAADMIVVDNLNDFNVKATYIDGIKVAENGKSLIQAVDVEPINQFHAKAIRTEDLFIKAPPKKKLQAIDVVEGELFTNVFYSDPVIENGNVVADLKNDVLKMVVMNRYTDKKPCVGFIHNIGFKRGAVASTVAHDSHNIIAVGTKDEDIQRAINLLVKTKGGISLVDGDKERILPLPIAGLMTAENAWEVAHKYENMEKAAKDLGAKVQTPFMTISFMALLVIPRLKLSDMGLFDGDTFKFTSLFVDADQID